MGRCARLWTICTSWLLCLEPDSRHAGAGGYTSELPGYVFIAEPLKLPAGHFVLGHSSGAHASDECLVIESSSPKVM